MKKTKKILVILLFIIVFLIIGTTSAKASSDLYLKNLDFDVQVNEDGSMDVTETWDINVSETNTLFKTFKTDKSRYTSISNVRVSEITNGTERYFEEINNLMYHVTKNCYYGLINNDRNFEIAWGVGLDNASATKTYKISYTVKDAIAKYSDYAELYWQFVGSDFEIDCGKITGTIILPENASSKDDIKVWGHTESLNGTIYWADLNKIEFEITDFRSGRYVEVRSLFPTEMIYSSGRSSSSNVLDKVIQEETKWADAANRKRRMNDSIKMLVTIVFLLICVYASIRIIKKTKEISELSSRKEKLRPTIDIKYFREIPSNLATPAQALCIYKNAETNFTSKEMGRIFSATLLSLSLKKCIEFETSPDKKDNTIIKILKKEKEDLPRSEKEVLEYIVRVAKNEEQITIKDLTKYMKRYATSLINTKDSIERSTKRELEERKIYNRKEAEEKSKYLTATWAGITTIIVLMFVIIPFFYMFIYGSILILGIIVLSILSIIQGITYSRYAKKLSPFTEQGLNEKEMWVGLKKYMEEFSLLDKREVPELALWEEFLVYATVFGIADKVLKQLKIVYKDMLENTSINTYTYMNLMLHTDFSSSFANSMNSAFSSAYSSVYSSGSGAGGGFSGGGGGGRWPEEVEEADNASFTFEKKLENNLGLGMIVYNLYLKRKERHEYKIN